MLTKHQVSIIQQALKDAGFYYYPVNGLWSPHTMTGYRNFCAVVLNKANSRRIQQPTSWDMVPDELKGSENAIEPSTTTDSEENAVTEDNKLSQQEGKVEAVSEKPVTAPETEPVTPTPPANEDKDDEHDDDDDGEDAPKSKRRRRSNSSK